MGIKFENLFSKNISSKIGVSSYNTSQSTKEELVPHLLMRKAQEIFERRPFIHSGMNDLISFVSGKGMFAKCTVEGNRNESGIKFLNAWIKQRKANLDQVKYQIILNYLVQGNSYIEKVFKPMSTELDNIFAVHDSSRIYYNNMPEMTNKTFWLFRVSDEMTNIMWRGTKAAITTYEPYKYSPSSNYFDSTIKAFRMNKKKLMHLRVPYTIDGFYGYSFIMSTIDDEEAIMKIISNIITISSNKAVGKKIIGFIDEGNRTIPVEDIQTLQDQLDFDMGSNLVVNKKFQVEDLAHTGTYDTMMPEIEYLTKDVSSGLTPTFMTPWNSEVNRATAEQARMPFIVRVEDIKQKVEDFFTECIVDELRKQHPKLMKGIEIEFGETQYFSLEEKKEFFGNLYDTNMITMNKYLSMIDLEPVENGDIYAREREALLDKKYQELGNDNFSDPGAGNTMEILSPTYFREANKIVNDELHDYEFENEESDTLKHAKKHMIDMTDEISQIIRRNLED